MQGTGEEDLPPEPEERAALVPPARRPPTAVGAGTPPPPRPPARPRVPLPRPPWGHRGLAGVVRAIAGAGLDAADALAAILTRLLGTARKHP